MQQIHNDRLPTAIALEGKHLRLSRLRLPRFGGRVGAALGVLVLSVCAYSQAPADSDSDKPMTVDQAVSIAIANNRNLKIYSLSVDSSKEKLEADKTHRYPSFSTYIFASQLLKPISFTVPAGQFGTFPSTGPIPATDTPITTPSQPTAYVMANASQPLLTLYKINLHIQGQELSVQQSAAKLREERISLTDDVRQAYYKVVQIQNAIEATQASIKQYQELDRISTQYLLEKVVLKSEALDVKAKLAQEQYKLLESQDQLQTAKETLNNLLGRDINTPFRAINVAELSSTEDNLAAAQALALEQQPKIKEAELTVKQAENARRFTKSQYLPDLAASFHYLSPFGVNFVPTNIMGLGFEFNWEPFDWGRRKHEVNEKTIEVEQSKLNLDDTRTQTLINVNTQFRALHEARVLVTVAEAKRASSQEKLQEVTYQYQQKTALLRDVLQQQASVDGANSDYNDAMAKFWTAKASFQKAIGEE